MIYDSEPTPTEIAEPTPDTPPQQPRAPHTSSNPPWSRYQQRRPWSSALAAAAVLAVAVAAAGAVGSDTDRPHVRVALDALGEAGVLDGTDCHQRGCWDQPLQRWTMAVWVSRSLGFTPNPNDASRFVDVNPDLW